MLDPPRRVVTGHDADGRAVLQEDGPPARTVTIGGEAGAVFHEIWHTRETPARLDRASGEPPEPGIVLAPPPGGTRIRFVDFPPEDARVAGLDAAEARARFAEMGAADASTHDGSAASRHPYMHRTESVDYGIVLSGEITLILDVGETLVRAGDVVVQRGTNHGWANRSGAPCRVAFVLVDARFEDDLA